MVVAIRYIQPASNRQPAVLLTTPPKIPPRCDLPDRPRPIHENPHRNFPPALPPGKKTAPATARAETTTPNRAPRFRWIKNGARDSTKLRALVEPSLAQTRAAHPEAHRELPPFVTFRRS